MKHLIILIIVSYFFVFAHSSHIHHSQVSILNCDDAIHGIGIDWNGADDHISEENYVCSQNERLNFILRNNPSSIANGALESCSSPQKMGAHVCLYERINYEEVVPTGGGHRPVWVTYGEYLFMPPQRWVHAIEHGAAVFLYDPCADPAEIEYFKHLANNCLRRHIITPYKKLQNDKFNIVTHSCRLQLQSVHGQEKAIISYLRRHAIKEGPEFTLFEDGAYNFGLIKKANIISDIKDSVICPRL